MNNIIRKSAIVTASVATLFFSTRVQAQDKLVYEKELNKSIAVTVQNGQGAVYTVKDKKGNIVLTGKINGKTINLPITRLKSGDYQFCIGQYTLQEFSVK